MNITSVFQFALITENSFNLETRVSLRWLLDGNRITRWVSRMKFYQWLILKQKSSIYHDYNLIFFTLKITENKTCYIKQGFSLVLQINSNVLQPFTKNYFVVYTNFNLNSCYSTKKYYSKKVFNFYNARCNTQRTTKRLVKRN